MLRQPLTHGSHKDICGAKLRKTLLFKTIMAPASRKSSYKTTECISDRQKRSNVVERDTARKVCALPEQKSVVLPANHNLLPVCRSCKLPSMRIPQQVFFFQRFPATDLLQLKKKHFQRLSFVRRFHDKHYATRLQQRTSSHLRL